VGTSPLTQISVKYININANSNWSLIGEFTLRTIPDEINESLNGHGGGCYINLELIDDQYYFTIYGREDEYEITINNSNKVFGKDLIYTIDWDIEKFKGRGYYSGIGVQYAEESYVGPSELMPSIVQVTSVEGN
jgi:hypothetical protein